LKKPVCKKNMQKLEQMLLLRCHLVAC
jgi:hypothetical protein